MEGAFYSLNSLRTMEVIDVNSGAKMGCIKDLKIDASVCKILAIILPSQKISWFGKNNDMEIPWSKVRKVGIDVILVDGNEYLIDKSE
ncbi:YlmC/YmxH family sporulation protein [Clostridium rectalis]|uniref:YlmC/YmxH family sporulation protein n=1 Tax=Clostridium rectalis TaxID=2040295 RepID=UPI000F63BC18|nr:YlmC/YmxH family sporulation protein [Clostridium rectalis]